MLMSDEIWQHPLCAAFDDELRARLRAAAADSAALAAEADALPAAEPRGRLPQQPAGRRAGRRPGDDRLRLLGRRAGRLRPQPAPRRRHPDRQARRRRPCRARRGDRDGVRRGAAGRGLRDPGGAGPARPRAVPADHDRAVDGAVRPVRGPDHARDAADRRGPSEAGPLRPRSPREHSGPARQLRPQSDRHRLLRGLAGSGSQLALVASSIVVSSNGSSPSSTRSSWARSRLSVQWPISTVATELPAKLVSARASDMNRSIPTIRPTPSTSSGRCELSPPARVAMPAPVTPAAPFDAIDHEDQQRDLLADRQRVAQRLGDEQRRHGQVDRGAVEVERVAGRDHDAHRRLVDAGVLHLGDQPRQRGLRGRRRQDQQELAGQVA